MKPSPQQRAYRQALKQAQGTLQHCSDSAALDALVLLEHASKRSKEWLIAHDQETMNELVNSRFQQMIAQRQRGTPVAYIIGEKEFWSLPFRVSPAVLIPRPDTELLVETALQIIRSERINTLLDLGTGSGCIAISIAKECPQLKITAVDNSADALEIAKKNRQRHQAFNVQLLQSDWFESLGQQQFDFIVSNPPYIADDDPDITSETRTYEPESAWLAKNNGLAEIAYIITHAGDYLTTNGTLLLEHGWQQHEKVQKLLAHNQYKNIRSLNDLQGYARATLGTW